MWISTLINALATWRRYRNNIRQLAALDDRMLRDIGLNRTELLGRAWEHAQR